MLPGRGGPASALTLPADPVDDPPGPITVNEASSLSEEEDDDVVVAGEEEEEVMVVVDDDDEATSVVLVFSFLNALGSSPTCKLVSTFTEALGSAYKGKKRGEERKREEGERIHR